MIILPLCFRQKLSMTCPLLMTVCWNVHGLTKRSFWQKFLTIVQWNINVNSMDWNNCLMVIFFDRIYMGRKIIRIRIPKSVREWTLGVLGLSTKTGYLLRKSLSVYDKSRFQKHSIISYVDLAKTVELGKYLRRFSSTIGGMTAGSDRSIKIALQSIKYIQLDSLQMSCFSSAFWQKRGIFIKMEFTIFDFGGLRFRGIINKMRRWFFEKEIS